MIPAEYKGEIIQTGLQFMKSITEAYGAEEGMKLWDGIASTLDPDIKAQIFFAMITGEYTTQIIISAQRTPNRVGAIKAIRSVTGLGLKEAKDLSDELEYKSIKLTVQPEHRLQSIKVLRDSGITV
jgi:ribosomal protein L7/L12